MQEYIPEEDATPKKRRIIRRVVRRIPKPSVVNSNSIEKHSEFDAHALHHEVEELQGTIYHANDSIAEETPVRSEESVLPSQTPSHRPKDMILEQFAHKKEKKDTVGYTSFDETVDDDSYPERGGKGHAYRSALPQEKQKFFSWIPWVMVPLAVCVFVIVGLSYFSGADVVIQAKQYPVSVDMKLDLVKDGGSDGQVPLTAFVIEDTSSLDVIATESKTTIATASGKVTLFNKQKTSQQLIKTTRLESPDGKIYRIRENVKIPAAVGEKPGTLDVMVYAESAGPDYNKKAGVEFTLPGLKGKPQYELVTGKSISDISGGSSGVKKTVPAEVMTETAKMLRVELENKLRARISRELLPQHVAYESLYQFTYFDPVLEPSDVEEKARVVLRGTVVVPVIERTVLASVVANKTLKDFDQGKVLLKQPELLQVAYATEEKIDFTKTEKVSISVKGDAIVVYSVDSIAFARALLNVPKGDVSKVASRFAGIEHVTATLHPFWKQYFPSAVDDIDIKIVE